MAVPKKSQNNSSRKKTSPKKTGAGGDSKGKRSDKSVESAVRPRTLLGWFTEKVLMPSFVLMSMIAMAAWLCAGVWMWCDLQGFFRSYSVEVYLSLLAVTVVVWQCAIDLLDWTDASLKKFVSVICRLAALGLALFALIQRGIITSPVDWIGKL